MESRKGFTLIETLIVIAISAMISAIAIGYSSVGRNQISLSVEATKISQLILQAKSLSIATYGDATDYCGFGVAFDISTQTYKLFAYHPGGPCPSISSVTGISNAQEAVYTDGTNNLHIANGVKVSLGTSGDGVAVAMFYPPTPQTLISRDSISFINPTPAISKVYLNTVDGSASKVISITSAGQVEF